MGRTFFFALIAFFLAFAVSCETENCKECEQVTYDSNGDEVDRKDEGEFCGDELEDKEEEEGTVGNQSYEYECTS